MKKFILFCACVIPNLALAGTEVVELQNEFDLSEVKFVKEKGAATVKGEATIVLEDQSIKNCSGFTVELLPSSEYSDERILKTYGNNEQGQILISQNPPKFTPDVKEYHEYLLKTKCGKDGKFIFNDVPEGTYYAIAFIIWDGVESKQGGGVMKRINVNQGESIRIALGASKLSR